MSHRIKRLAAFAIFARFYLVAALDSISGLFGHQVDTKLDTKTITATTESSLSDEPDFWCPVPRSQSKKIRSLFDALNGPSSKKSGIT